MGRQAALIEAIGEGGAKWLHEKGERLHLHLGVGGFLGQQEVHVLEEELEGIFLLLQGALGGEHEVHLLVPGLHGEHQPQLLRRELLLQDLPVQRGPGSVGMPLTKQSSMASPMIQQERDHCWDLKTWPHILAEALFWGHRNSDSNRV